MKVGDQIIEVYLNHKMDELYAEAGRYTQEIDIVKSKIVSKQTSIDDIRGITYFYIEVDSITSSESIVY